MHIVSFPCGSGQLVPGGRSKRCLVNDEVWDILSEYFPGIQKVEVAAGECILCREEKEVGRTPCFAALLYLSICLEIMVFASFLQDQQKSEERQRQLAIAYKQALPNLCRHALPDCPEQLLRKNPGHGHFLVCSDYLRRFVDFIRFVSKVYLIDSPYQECRSVHIGFEHMRPVDISEFGLSGSNG